MPKSNSRGGTDARTKHKKPKSLSVHVRSLPESQQPAIDYIQANWPCAWALHDKDTHTEQEFLDYGKHHDGNCQIGK